MMIDVFPDVTDVVESSGKQQTPEPSCEFSDSKLPVLKSGLCEARPFAHHRDHHMREFSDLS